MKSEMESLAADLNVNGLHAWGRLYDTLTGKMEFEMTFPDGHKEVVPMSRRRALMSEPDRKTARGGLSRWAEALE
jgi:oligoendopeptidase F